ncbi:ABC transporter substrate-binding protein [Sporichthya polymorpha]|uniref:ABC transporter substrate-binding protein n=1 Tax=Sporichthya polymorpha TaxID=35751 RepID=UPI00037BA15C|nr:ABC transporter substrate-binding protein [Sporichthya polymorpha]
MRARRTVAALAAAVALLASGCGTRASEEEVRAGVGGGPVELDPAALDQLRDAGAGTGALPGAPAPARGPADASTDAVPGTVPQSGSGTAPGTDSPGTAGAPSTSAPAAAAGTGSSGGACTKPGVPLHIGQVGSFSGVFGPLVGSARTGFAVWIKHINASGGLACHPIVLHAVDDGGDPSRGSALVGEMVSKYNVQAFVGMASMALPGMVGAIERTKLPVVGGDLVSDPWFAHPQFFPQGGGLRAIVDGALKQAVADGRTVHGLLYCVEVGVCGSVAKMLPDRAKVAGAKVVYSSPVSLTQTDFTAQCQNAKNAGVQAFGMAVDGSAIARVARSCAALNYFPQFVTGGPVVSNEQAKDPGIRRNTMSTASANAPWFRTDTPGQREYAEALKRYAPGFEVDGPSMLAWAAGKLFQAAVERLGDAARNAPVTSADIFTGLGKIRNETLDGLSPPITFTPGQKAAPDIPCVFFALDSEKGWTAPNSTYVCTKVDR